ncbi:unnamed protein product [Paramecium primaurelia]|uniref:Uncharacterized protein n=1 Tax=Paramecium primaurelia TaxID=5886 RepID=A0A8S1Q976_PARPR|nr:unnamed protein product [Paramecium primaurelia]
MLQNLQDLLRSSDISLSSNNSCDSSKDRTDQKFLQIPDGFQDKYDNNKDDEDYVCIEDINLQDKCEDNCPKCTSTQSCLISLLILFQKITIDGLNNQQENFMIYQQQKALRIQYFSLFHHIIHLISKKMMLFIIATFQIKEYLEDHQYEVMLNLNLLKVGQKSFNLQNIFEVILGDISLNNNKFTHKLNDQQLETITLKENYSGQNPNIQDQIWPRDYKLNIYQVDKSIHYQMSTNKQLPMEIKCQNNRQLSFCGFLFKKKNHIQTKFFQNRN